jgi:DNA primase
MNPPLSFSLKEIAPRHPYVQGRGIDEQIATIFGIGAFTGRGSFAGRVVIPIHDAAGRLIAYAGRSIDASKPKYKFPRGFNKSIELWNLDRVLALGNTVKSVIVVQGFFDCVRVYAAGFPNVVALMGRRLSEAQEKILSAHFRKAVLFFDGDERGVRVAKEIAVQLARRIFVRLISTREKLDILSSHEIRTALESVQFNPC